MLKRDNVQTGWKPVLWWIAGLLTIIMVAWTVIPTEAPLRPVIVDTQLERYLTPYDELPPNNSACRQVWKDYAGSYYGTIVTFGEVSRTHYGDIRYYDRKSGKVVKTQLAGCTYYSSPYGREVVMIINGRDVSEEGAMRYVWHVDDSGRTVIEMAGSYGDSTE